MKNAIMSTSNGNNDKNDEFQGSTGEGNGLSPGLEPTARNSLVLYDNNLFIQMHQQQPQQEPVYSRAHQVAAQAATAAAQASQVPMTSHLATGGQDIGRNGNKVASVKSNVMIRPRRPLPQEGRKAVMMMPRAELQQKQDSYSGASCLGNEELQRHSGSVARTMAINPGSWGKGVKRRAPMELDEDDAMSGEKLNITQKLKSFDSSNQEVDVVGGSKEEEEEVQDLSKGANKAYAPQSWLLHKLLSDETPAEAKPKVNPTATATADGDMSPAGESIHKKFEYKRWSAGVRAKSKPGLVQGSNLVAGPTSGSFTGAGPLNGPCSVPGPVNESFVPGPVNESFTAPGPVSGPYPAPGLVDESFSALGPVNRPYTAPGPMNGSYTSPGAVTGAQNLVWPGNSPQNTALPKIETYIPSGTVNGAQNAVRFFSASQNAAGITPGPYIGAGPVNGLQNAFGFVNPPEPVNRAQTSVKPVNGPLIATGTLRELLSAKIPFKNPYGIVAPVPKGPTPSTSTSSAAGENGRPVIPPEQLQKMLGELVLSPYITETQAVARLKTLGTTQNVQAEIDRFAAIISCGNAFAANRANAQKQQQQQQQQQQEQQRQDNAATSISTAAKDLIQAKHRESVIKGVPKK